MNKRYISFLLCLILVFTFISVTACATDISKIKPDGYDDDTWIVIPNNSTTVTYVYKPDSTTVIVIPGNTTTTTITQTIPETTPTPVSTPTYTYDIDTPEEIEQTITDDLISEIFNETNQQRLNIKLHALNYNYDLQYAADLRAKEISTKFSHTRPNGTDCSTVVTIDYHVTGENIIMADNDIASADILMDTWMNSEGHRHNILLPDYTSMAIGIYRANGVTYAVQIFLG